MCYPCQACHHHAQGHPAGQENPWGEGLDSQPARTRTLSYELTCCFVLLSFVCNAVCLHVLSFTFLSKCYLLPSPLIQNNKGCISKCYLLPSPLIQNNKGCTCTTSVQIINNKWVCPNPQVTPIYNATMNRGFPQYHEIWGRV